MKYKITIIKYEKNENYEEEMAKFKEDNIYKRFRDLNMGPEEPSLEKASRSLEVFLTEEEYNAVKKSVLETFN